MSEKFSKTKLLTKLSVKDIEEMIVGNPYKLRQYMYVPNVSWGFFREHEADLVGFSNAGVLTEYEIKRSWHDFLADYKKKSYHEDDRISRLYYVVPEVMAKAASDYIDERWNTDDVYKSYYRPGVIAYTEDRTYKITKICNYPTSNKHMYIENIVEIERLGCLKYWDLRKSRSWHLLTQENENDVYKYIEDGNAVLFAKEDENGKISYYQHDQLPGSIGTHAKDENYYFFYLPQLN